MEHPWFFSPGAQNMDIVHAKNIHIAERSLTDGRFRRSIRSGAGYAGGSLVVWLWRPFSLLLSALVTLAFLSPMGIHIDILLAVLHLC